MTRQQFATVDVVRLEVAEPPTGLVNLVSNPNGELGGWGWVTPVADTVVNADPSGTYLRAVTEVAQAFHVLSEAMPVAAGDRVAARLALGEASTISYVRLRLRWLDNTGAELALSTQSPYIPVTSEVAQLAPQVAPTGAAYAQLRLDLWDSNAGTNPGAGDELWFREVTVAASATGDGLGEVRTNLMPTPSFEAAPGAGTTAVEGSRDQSDAWSAVGTYSLRLFRAGGTGDGTARTRLGLINVTAGASYAVRVGARGDLTGVGVGQFWQAQIVWFGPGAVELGSDALFVAQRENAYQELTGAKEAPAGATSMRVQITAFGMVAGGESFYVDQVLVEQAEVAGTYFDGDTADSDEITYDWTGTAHGSSSVKLVAGELPYLPPITWRQILGNAYTLRIGRHEADVGELTAELVGTALDPAKTNLIRSGRRCRVLAKVTGEGDRWSELFVGKVADAKVTYKLTGPNGKRTRISLRATDDVTALANTPRREGVPTIPELPYVLEGAGVPWSVNGSGDQVAAADVVSTNDSASALDQAVLTRDSVGGYVWVDRRGILQAWDADQLDTTPAAVLDEGTYSNLVLDYDTTRCINVLTVRFLRLDIGTGQTTEVTYGPYVDSTSVAEWGQHEGSVAIQRVVEDEEEIEAFAAAVLAANSVPEIQPQSVRLPIRSTEQFRMTPGDRRAFLDLLDLVTVAHEDTGTNTDLRIRDLVHEITGSRWSVELSFAAPFRLATTRATPSPTRGAS